MQQVPLQPPTERTGTGTRCKEETGGGPTNVELQIFKLLAQHEAYTYCSPANSSYSQKRDYDPFQVLTSDIEKFKESGQVIVMGDFNARTGNLCDLVVNDKCENVPELKSLNSDDGVNSRISQDSSGRVCRYGTCLIKMCVSTDLKK